MVGGKLLGGSGAFRPKRVRDVAYRGVHPARRRCTAIADNRLGAVLGRGVLGILPFGCFLAVLPLMPRPGVFAIVMAGPLVVTCLSVALLKESVGRSHDLIRESGCAARRRGDYRLASG